MLHPVLVIDALLGVPEGQKCEFCGKKDDVQVEKIGLHGAAWSCRRCRALGQTIPVNPEEQGTIRRSKKPKRLTEKTQPPSRGWIVRENKRKMWEQMVKLHGIAIDDLDEHGELSDWEKNLIREFGYYRNNPTLGHFRCRDGSVLEPTEDEPVEVSLFNN